MAFLGYKGGYDNIGKGTPDGDGKDKAMRSIADSIIVESILPLHTNYMDSKSSTATSFKYVYDNRMVKLMPVGSNYGMHYSYLLYNTQVITSPIVMLARNCKLKHMDLLYATESKIKWLTDLFNAFFIVGDMPGVDSQFIDCLNRCNSNYYIYHTGAKSRI